MTQLVNQGADVNLFDDMKCCPLQVAIRYKNVPLDVIAQLVSSKNININDSDFDTALHWVVSEKRWELVSVLLQHGADVNICRHGNITPLHEATYHTDVPLDAVTKLVSPQNINMKDDNGRTALHLVVLKKRWDLVPLLINPGLKHHGADVNICDMYLKRTPLHQAVSQQHVPLSVVTQLISSQNINIQDDSGCSVLDLVAKNRRWDLLPVLIQHGADVNQCNRWNKTPLHKAVIETTIPPDVVTQLISPQNINMQDSRGHTALNLFVSGQRWELGHDLFSRLLRNGAQCHVSDIIASITSHYNAACVRQLLQHLCMPYHLRHVEFIFSLNHMEKLKVDNSVIMVPRHPAMSLPCLVDIICHLLQQTCLVKAQFYARLEDNHTNVDASIVSYVVQKHSEFEDISHNPASLEKLSMVAIRQHLPIKSDENFARLGLPPGLLSLVTLSCLAEDLHQMWL